MCCTLQVCILKLHIPTKCRERNWKKCKKKNTQQMSFVLSLYKFQGNNIYCLTFWKSRKRSLKLRIWINPANNNATKILINIQSLQFHIPKYGAKFKTKTNYHKFENLETLRNWYFAKNKNCIFFHSMQHV